MSAPIFSSTEAQPGTLQSRVVEKVKPFLAPYYLTVAGVLGALTVGFVIVTVLLILVVANFNVLGLIE